MPGPGQSKPRRLPYILVLAAAVLAALCIGLYYLLRPAAPAETTGKTVAVLPFLNLSDQKEEEYFSDGITEDILSQLAQIPDLNVISRTSIMQYKGTQKPIRDIGRELHAGYILEGSVRRAGDQVRISAQFIDATNDKHLWAETYDREYRQIFSIQSEISRNIAAALKARFAAAETRAGAGSAATGNPEAYTLLLQGRYFAERRDSVGLIRAIDLYRRALAIDSLNARVWASLAMAYGYFFTSTGIPWKEAVVKARQAAERAIALDDNLADGHAALGYLLNASTWDWEGADREFRKARELEPGNSTTMRWTALLAMSLGRFDEAIGLLQKAIELDPVQSSNYLDLALAYGSTRDYARAREFARKALEVSPQMGVSHHLLGLLYLLQGDVDSARVQTEQEPDVVFRTFGMALVHEAAGRKAQADAALADFIKNYQDQGAFQIAEFYGFRGDADRAFQWLEHSYQTHDPGISMIKGDPLLTRIEKDPRYIPFLRKLKLPVD